MAENITQQKSVQPLGEYSLSVDAPAGWDDFRLFNDPIFTGACMFMGVFGGIAGAFWLMRFEGLINDYIYNFARCFLIICLFGGGLSLIKELNFKRSVMIAVFITTGILWENIFLKSPKPLMFVLVASSWLVFWWTWKKPELMKRFGLRRETFLVDLLKALLPLSMVIALVVIDFMVFGFKLDISPWEDAARTCGLLTYNLIVFMFFFLVLSELQNHGMDWKSYILTICVLALLYQTPTIGVFYAVGKVNLMLAIGGIISNTMVLLLIMITMFKTQKNILLAVLTETSIMVIMDMAGLM